MFPVDTIKTRKQAAPAPAPSPSGCMGCPEAAAAANLRTSGLAMAGAGSAAERTAGAASTSSAAPKSHTLRAVSAAAASPAWPAAARADPAAARRAAPPLPAAESASLASIVRREGLRGVTRLYRGVGAAAAGAGPAHAVYFSVYEAVKDALVGSREGEAHPLAAALASSCATVVSDGMMTPADVVKQRMQVCHSPYRNIWDCAARLLRTEGAAVFYRSYGTTLLMNIPFTAVNFGMYDLCKNTLAGDGQGGGVGTHVASGAVAGGCAAAATTPLDVVKTRLQTDTVPRKGGEVFRMVWAEGGARALFTGVGPRVAFHMPAVAICWGTYEAVKKFILPPM